MQRGELPVGVEEHSAEVKETGYPWRGDLLLPAYLRDVEAVGADRGTLDWRGSVRGAVCYLVQPRELQCNLFRD